MRFFMNNRREFDYEIDQENGMTSACTILREMLRRPANQQSKF